MGRDNPLGLAGFEFCEFTGPDTDAVAALFEQLRFVAAHRHPTRDIIRYKQGRINFLLIRETEGRAADFEVIQRKRNDGFGNGNFQALFESIGFDQTRAWRRRGKRMMGRLDTCRIATSKTPPRSCASPPARQEG
jgi:4-hydroxyphenylpyruvate dioxygenase-like putative hemolysin